MSTTTTQRRPSSGDGDSVALLPGYKRSDVGIIPQDWEERLLAELGLFIKGKGIKRDDVTADGVACIRYGELYTRYNNFVRTPTSRIPESVAASSQELQAGDLLFAGSGETAEEIGKCVAYLGEEVAYAGGDIVILRPSGQNSLYLGHLLNQEVVSNQKARFGQGDAVVHISARNLAIVKVPLPPATEQRAIAQALSDVDGLVGALEALITKKLAIKLAAMQRLLTGKIRLPGFGGEWETRRLGEHVTYLRTGVNSRAELASEGAVSYLHYGDIHSSTRVRLDPHSDSMPCLPEKRARTLDRLRDGDLVFVDASEDLQGVGTSVELTGVSGAQVVAGLHTIAARFDKSVLADGFKAYLQFCPAFRDHLRRLAAGTKVYATNRTHISSVEIRLPYANEQTAIAAVLSDMDAEISALERSHEKSRAIKQGMMQQLLTGRVRLVKPTPGTR